MNRSWKQSSFVLAGEVGLLMLASVCNLWPRRAAKPVCCTEKSFN
jgi:hypothetical protein